MKGIFENPNDMITPAGPSAVALGLFDGVHPGHMAVLSAAKLQEQNGLKPCVFTFDAETAGYKGSGGYLYDSSVRRELIAEKAGIDCVISLPFSEISSMSGEEFAAYVLCDRLQAAYVCCGKNFRFGKNASCGTEELAGFGRKFGFTVGIADEVTADGRTISSSLIRGELAQGRAEAAAELLGFPYYIVQKVTHGAQLGRTIGFPTINQLYRSGQFVPRFGVYASEVRLPDGTHRRAMTNIGIKPTVDYHGIPLAETYIFDYSGDLYEKTIQTGLLHFVRPEQRFGSVAELTAQLQRDMAECRPD